MAIVDIVFIVFVAIFGFIGLKKGFIKSILGLFKFVVTLALVIWLAPKFASFIDGLFGNAISNYFTNLMGSTVSSFGGSYIGTTLESDVQASVIVDSFAKVNSVFKALIKVIVGNAVLTSGTVVNDYFASAIGSFITIAVSAILLYIIIRLVIFLLGKLFDKLKISHKSFGWVDRILGFALGCVKGLLIVAIALIVLRAFGFVPFINDFITNIVSSGDWLSQFANWAFAKCDQLIDSIDFNAIIKGK